MDGFSLLSSKIEDNKQEKIAFVIDLSSEVLNEDFLTNSGEKIERLKMLHEEISNFVKLKDYFTSKPCEFALYSYTQKFNKEIEFCELKEFDMKFSNFYNTLRSKVIEAKEYLDLAQVFSEAIYSLNTTKENRENKNINAASSSRILNSEILTRYILFYNRSNMPAINSNDKELNTMTFIRMTNFYFDVVFLRKKINSDEDKKILSEVYSSLKTVKTKNWYSFEISGNHNKFKFYVNLLLANANQRLKITEVEKHQRKIEELAGSYIIDG
jgi:hypothetical protein